MNVWKQGLNFTGAHQPADKPLRRLRPVLTGKPARAILLALVLAPTPLAAQNPAAPNMHPIDCDAYARSYANAHTSADTTDLPLVDGALEGAVAGGAWKGPDGARRGARAGAALSVLDTLGNYPAGWRGLYDLAFSLCRNQQSPIVHRPSTLGDPSYRPLQPAPGRVEPSRPAGPLEPMKPQN